MHIMLGFPSLSSLMADTPRAFVASRTIPFGVSMACRASVCPLLIRSCI